MKKVIFSDIDGCIITYPTGDLTQVIKIIARLHQYNIDLILATSKSADEVIALNEILCLPGPFIIENGGGVLFKEQDSFDCHEYDVLRIGSYKLLKLCKKKPDLVKLKLLCDPDIDLLSNISDVMWSDLSGLSLEQASLSKIRYFTEMIYIMNVSAPRLLMLKHQLYQSNLYFTQAERLLCTYTDYYLNKGSGVKFILSNYYHHEPCQTFAIGDGLNDFSMFGVCDRAFYIHKQHKLQKKHDWSMAFENIISL